MIRRILGRVLRRATPRVPNARSRGRTPPQHRSDWTPPATKAAETPPPADDHEPEVEISAAEVADWIAAGRDVCLLDIREPHELRHGHAAGARLIPMNDVPHNTQRLPTDTTLVVYCAAGVRSFGVSHWLREQGFSDTWSLTGGLGAWLETGAEWIQPSRDAPFPLLTRVCVANNAPDTLPAAGTIGIIQAVRPDTVDVLFLPDGSPAIWKSHVGTDSLSTASTDAPRPTRATS